MPPETAPAASRPRLHYTPPSGWLNDPNGMVYLDGEYHLFYQCHPHSLVWGPMHWGHAVSRDLASWQTLPLALEPDELGMIFSGSAVVDRANTAGFGPGALVAVFTHHTDQRQVQSLAYSTDRGRSWTKYAGNPVLAPPDAPPDFRDPRVFWFGPPAGGHWVMLLAVGHEVWFYTSPDLKAWTRASVFGAGYGAHDGVWECPDLLELPVEGDAERRWMLVVSVLQGAPAGGSGTQYFVGAFDGAGFRSDDPPGTVRWADYGADFYATQSWGEAPDGRAIWLAWMNNWDYARETPATTWRGMMSAPRELALRRDADGLRLAQRLAPELTAGWLARLRLDERLLDAGSHPLGGAQGETLLVDLAFRLEGATAGRCGLRLRVGADEATTVSYDLGRAALVVERAAVAPGGVGAAPQVVSLAPRDGLLRLRLLLDSASLEIFADEGGVCVSNQIFPRPESSGLELFAEGGGVTLERLELWAPEA